MGHRMTLAMRSTLKKASQYGLLTMKKRFVISLLSYGVEQDMVSKWYFRAYGGNILLRRKRVPRDGMYRKEAPWDTD